jgi:hypothetical protein
MIIGNLEICTGKFTVKMSLKFLLDSYCLKKLTETFENGSYALHSPAEALLFDFFYMNIHLDKSSGTLTSPVGLRIHCYFCIC